MAHPEQKNFIASIKDKFTNHFVDKKILEIGSLNINGTIRDLFENCDYTGIDVGQGDCVDIVCSGHLYDAPDNTYDVVVSSECFEHNPEWVATFKNMQRMCKPGGLVIMTCATTGREEHGTTRTSPKDSPLTIGIGWEYYRNLTEEDFRNEMDVNAMFVDHKFWQEIRPNNLNDLYFCGIK
jgi:SAM-dependent methyltransferase